MAGAGLNLIDNETLALLESRDLNVRGLMEGLFGGNRRSARYGSSMDFADYRDYMPGDDPRRVDWNLWARTDKLYLRLFADERRQHHRIYIDCSASMAWGRPEKHFVALQTAAALGYLAVSGMDRVSWYALRENRSERIGEAVSGREKWAVELDKLAAVSCGGDTKLAEAVMSCPDPGREDGISFILSDFLTDGDWKSAADWLLDRGREVCLIRILSPDEAEPSLWGKLRLTDAEAFGEDDARNFRMDIGRERRQAYAAALAWLNEEIGRFCAARRIRVFTATCDRPLSRILFEGAVRSEMVR